MGHPTPDPSELWPHRVACYAGVGAMVWAAAWLCAAAVHAVSLALANALLVTWHGAQLATAAASAVLPWTPHAAGAALAANAAWWAWRTVPRFARDVCRGARIALALRRAARDFRPDAHCIAASWLPPPARSLEDQVADALFVATSQDAPPHVRAHVYMAFLRPFAL